MKFTAELLESNDFKDMINEQNRNLLLNANESNQCNFSLILDLGIIPCKGNSYVTVDNFKKAFNNLHTNEFENLIFANINMDFDQIFNKDLVNKDANFKERFSQNLALTTISVNNKPNDLSQGVKWIKPHESCCNYN